MFLRKERNVTKREILVVDDDRLLLKSLAVVLGEAGYAVRTANSGVKALDEVRARRPDLVLLDVMMPKRDGLDVCRELRAADASLPIVFLTALATAEDELKGLSAGGDVYIPKTTPDDLLLARIAAILRPRGDGPSEPTGDFAFGNWRVEAANLTLRGDGGRRVRISERELYLLRLFATHPDEVFTREALVRRLWDGSDEPDDNALSVAIYALRKKLGAAGEAIVALRGVGYVYRP